MDKPMAYSHIVRKAAIQEAERTFSHPWNLASQITGTRMSQLAGLRRFVAFPTPSVAHNVANRGSEELVYLMGGENRPNEVADFPALDRRMVKLDNKVSIYRLSDGKAFGGDDA